MSQKLIILGHSAPEIPYKFYNTSVIHPGSFQLWHLSSLEKMTIAKSDPFCWGRSYKEPFQLNALHLSSTKFALA